MYLCLLDPAGCYNVPRQANQPCDGDNPCDKDAGLTCDLSTGRCAAPATEKQSCHASRPCAEGLSCHPGYQQCFPSPRTEGQPCSADPDKPELHCAAQTPDLQPLSCDYKATMRCVRYQVRASLVEREACMKGCRHQS